MRRIIFLTSALALSIEPFPVEKQGKQTKNMKEKIEQIRAKNHRIDYAGRLASICPVSWHTGTENKTRFRKYFGIAWNWILTVALVKNSVLNKHKKTSYHPLIKPNLLPSSKLNCVADR